jgi:bla regulator protein blaR1
MQIDRALPDADALRRGDAQGSTALERQLIDAAESGDLGGIAVLISAGADVNGKVPGDGSPLIGAARRGQLAAVRLLLNRGADPNLVVAGDGSPLIAAARTGQIATVELLLSRGASIEQVADGDENALIQASGAGQLSAVRLLVARGADVNARVWVEQGWTAPNILRQDGEWRTPLGMAERAGHASIVEYLRSVGARY